MSEETKREDAHTRELEDTEQDELEEDDDYDYVITDCGRLLAMLYVILYYFIFYHPR